MELLVDASGSAQQFPTLSITCQPSIKMSLMLSIATLMEHLNIYVHLIEKC